MSEGIKREMMTQSGLKILGWVDCGLIYIYPLASLAFGDSDRLRTQTLKEE